MTHRNIIIWGASAAVIVVMGAWLHLATVARRTEALAELQREIASVRDMIATAQNTDAVRVELRAKTQQLNAALPAGDDLADLLGPLTKDLTSLTEPDRSLVTSAAERTDQLTKIPLLVSFHSSFPAVFELMARVSDYTRIVRVRQLVITRAPESDGSTVSVSARFVTFARSTEEGW